MTALSMRRTLRRLLLPLAAAVAWAPSGHASQTPSTDVVLGRAADYVARFVEAFSNVVATERYTQEVLQPGQRQPFPGVRPPNSYRELSSDFLLLKVGGPFEWRPYRDVFEVDGRPVRDRDDRLARLFLDPSQSALQLAARIALESSRYNIGLTRRTINTPVLAILFLQRHIQPRFTFTAGRPDRALGDGVWTVEYREHARPTVIRGLTEDDDVDLPASGRFWIDVDTGRVARTELILSGLRMRANLTTTFQDDARFGMAVPVGMREEYGLEHAIVRGTATYDNFRRFEVTTQTTAGAPGR
jgi:hypothetical protein